MTAPAQFDEPECKLHEGSFFASGYGSIHISGRNYRAHRVAYAKANGIELDRITGLKVLHRCDNPPCVEPTHLFLGTQSENNKDRAMKGRSARLTGSANPAAELSEEQVIACRLRYVPRCRHNGASAMARELGVDKSTMALAVTGVTWTHLNLKNQMT